MMIFKLLITFLCVASLAFMLEFEFESWVLSCAYFIFYPLSHAMVEDIRTGDK